MLVRYKVKIELDWIGEVITTSEQVVTLENGLSRDEIIKEVEDTFYADLLDEENAKEEQEEVLTLDDLLKSVVSMDVILLGEHHKKIKDYKIQEALKLFVSKELSLTEQKEFYDTQVVDETQTFWMNFNSDLNGLSFVIDDGEVIGVEASIEVKGDPKVDSYGHIAFEKKDYYVKSVETIAIEG